MTAAWFTGLICAPVLLVSLVSLAAAQPVRDLTNTQLEGELEPPEGALLVETPEGVRTYDAAGAARRLEQLDRARAVTRDPVARAKLSLERAALRGAQARHEKLAMIEAQLRRDEAKDPAAKQAIDPEIARRRAASARANAAAISELTEIVCDPADRARGLACRAPTALRRWPELDEALLQLASALESERRADDAARVYRRLADDHPSSRHRGAALVAIAERAFEQVDLATAERFYGDALATPAAQAAVPVRAYAAYKLGWVHYNLTRGQDALASFATAIALAGADPKSAALARSARKDLPRAFALYGTPSGAFAAFEAAAPGHGLELLASLGQIWLDSAASREAALVFHDLLRRAPSDPRRCDWQLGLAQAAQLTAVPADLAREAATLATALAKALGQPALSRCVHDGRRFLRDAVERELRAASTTRTASTAELAESLAAAAVVAFIGANEHPGFVLLRADAAFLLAESSAAAHPTPPRTSTANLWRLAAARYDEAAKLPGLRRPDRTRALAARDEATRRAGTP